jgi:hypothetical protein
MFRKTQSTENRDNLNIEHPRKKYIEQREKCLKNLLKFPRT